MKRNKGVTLISLIVAIIILLILSVIGINIALGENGLISTAEKTRIEYIHSSVWDGMTLEYTTFMVKEKNTFNGTFIKYLQAKNVISTDKVSGGYVINTEALLDEAVDLGNGTDGINDVYKLEEITTDMGNKTRLALTNGVKIADVSEDDKQYRVKYYGESGDRELGILEENLLSVIKSENPNFTIAKTADTSISYEIGDTIKYEITIKNTGNVPMKNVMIEEVLTSLTGTYKPGSKDIKIVDNSRVICNGGRFIIEQIGVNETIKFEYSYTIKKGDVGDSGGKIISTVKSFTADPQPEVPDGTVIPPVVIELLPGTGTDTPEPPPPPPPEKPEISYGRLEVICTGGIGEDFIGAKFELHEKDSNKLERTIEMGNKTSITIDNIPVGNYEIVPVVTPEGYNPPSSTSFDVVIQKDQVTKIEIEFSKGRSLPAFSGVAENVVGNSFTLNSIVDGVVLEGYGYSLYEIGTISEDGTKIEAIGEFSDFFESFAIDSTDNIIQLLKQLDETIENEMLTPFLVYNSDYQGQCTFDGLEKGVYLVRPSSKDFSTGGTTYSFDPFIINVQAESVGAPATVLNVLFKMTSK